MGDYFVMLSELAEHYNLKTITQTTDISTIKICVPEVNRPALQLAGFYDYFDEEPIQIIGKVEYSYLEGLSDWERSATLRRLFDCKIPCVIFTRGIEPFPEAIDFAESAGVPLLQTTDATSDFTADVIRWMKVALAPRISMHGVFVDIFGEGVLIIGESGIGKSETALELVKRGHRLIADDSVEVKRVSNETLIGTCPEILRYFIELRGIGIIDVQQMFGVEAIKATQNIDLVIKLEVWDKMKGYDRLGLNEEYMDILGIDIVCHSIPIRPGRNIAIICESAAINHRQKKMGYNAAKALQERVESKFIANNP
ncbi:MAG: HPr(Ser) kinase/phosphatase [Clostridiales bacterium]|jgi:HPr kinase/phosphorylase|nr:HPr(Ser) kinase/phosphatase [Clostridiales bacterium]